MATVLYRVVALPDPSDPRHVHVAGGNVKGAISLAAEHWARVVGDMPNASVTAVVRFAYTPTPADRHPQSRLSIYVGANAETEAATRSMRSVIQAGPLTRYYELSEAKEAPIPWGKFSAACRICRRDSLVRPLTAVNPSRLAWYYTCAPFDPDDSNDFMMLDQVLGGLREHVLIDMAFRPANVAEETAAHTRYLDQLKAINQSRGGVDGEPTIDLLEDEDARFSPSLKVEPLRQPDPTADEVRKQQDAIGKTLQAPHVQFHLLVLAESESTSRLVGSLLAESGFQSGSYQLHVTTRPKYLGHYRQCLRDMVVGSHTADPDLTRNAKQAAIPGLARLAHVASIDEMLGVWRLPVPAQKHPVCIRKNTDPPAAEDPSLLVMGYDAAGPAQDDPDGPASPAPGIRRIPRGIAVTALVKHMFNCGLPGSGKTTCNMQLLLKLHELGIPFIVIETAKTEYRVLRMLGHHPRAAARDLAGKVEIYTPGNESLSPLRFNPLQLIPGISVEEHIDALLACFSAAMPLMGPLPPLLGEGLERVYEQAAAAEDPPLLNRLVHAVRACLTAKGYSPDVSSDIRAAIDVRLGTLMRRTMGRIFQCPVSVPDVNHLLTTPTIIELDRLSSEHAALVTLFLLTAIREAIKVTPRKGKDDRPRIVLFIEEAHNVVGRSTDARMSEDAADPKAFAAEYITRMLAELRALGVGIVISDQLPTAVAPEVIKNTASKIAFRQVAEEDRKQIGATMLFGPIEETEIARLQPGSAYWFTEGYFGPRRIITADLRAEAPLPTPTDGELRQSLEQAPWFQSATNARRTAEVKHLRRMLDATATTCSGLQSRIRAVLADFAQGFEQEAHESAQEGELTKRLLGLRADMEQTIRAFETMQWKRYVVPEPETAPIDKGLADQMTELTAKWAEVRRAAAQAIESIVKATKG